MLSKEYDFQSIIIRDPYAYIQEKNRTSKTQFTTVTKIERVWHKQRIKEQKKNLPSI